MRTLVPLVAALILASSASAQPSGAGARSDSRPEAIDRVYACSSQTEDAARLACYDAAVGHLKEAERTGEIVSVDRAQAATVQREAFGFSLPSISRLLPRLNTGEQQQVSEINAQLVRIGGGGDGRHIFVLENGQTWAQVEPGSIDDVETGRNVRIRRATLGSFLMTPEHGYKAYRVRRVE